MTANFAIKQGPWKLVLARGSGGWSLPETKAPPTPRPPTLQHPDDAGEKVNQYDKHPEIVAQLKSVLNGFEKSGRSTNSK
jgi:hypothetical protein